MAEPFRFVGREILELRCVLEKNKKKTGRFENPLMPDERLRQMYTAMVQVRMLEEDLARRARRLKGKREAATIRGEEAARASTALSLAAGDLLSDCVASAGMDLLLGDRLGEVRARVRSKVAAPERPEAGEGRVLRMPVSEAGKERLELALGAALALRTQGAGRVLLVYARAGEIGTKHWKRVSHAAGKGELPVIFVLLPGGDEEDASDTGEMARRSGRWGVPGFPVDGADAIGLYRVMQESLLRARMGGGPALIECIRFAVHGAKRARQEDPIERLKELMLTKGAASAEWLTETRSAFARRLRGRG